MGENKRLSAVDVGGAAKAIPSRIIVRRVNENIGVQMTPRRMRDVIVQNACLWHAVAQQALVAVRFVMNAHPRPQVHLFRGDIDDSGSAYASNRAIEKLC